MLQPELSGILNWLLEGVARYQNERETIPPACLEVLAEYRGANDPLAQFVEECLIVKSDAWTSSAELLKVAKAWGTTHNIQRLAGGSSLKLKTSLESHHLTKGRIMKKKKRDINGFSGLMLNPEAEKRYCSFSGGNLLRNSVTNN